MTVLAASVVDATIILALGLALATALRRRSAAIRHGVLTLSIICAALTPALELVLPQLPVIRWFDSDLGGSSEIKLSGESSLTVAQVATEASSSSLAVQWPMVIGVVWATVGVITLAGFVVSLWQLRKLRASCVPIEGRWRTLTDGLARECGVTRPVQLLQSPDAALLVTYGVFRPLIILPAGSQDWSSERQVVVIRHELAHIRRRDAATQVAGELLRVMQPFNPLVWIACRQLRRESEYACDDAVLSGGVKAADYATHLFDIAKGLSGRQTIWATAPAIAEPSTLERRIVAMLQSQKNRRPLSRVGWTLVTVAAAIVTLPIAAIGMAPDRIAAPAAPQLNTSTPSLVTAAAPSAPAPIVPARKIVRAKQASLTGRVQDETGGATPGAAVLLTNSQTQESSAAITNASGAFQFVNLPAGQYELVAQLNGFRKKRVAIELGAGSTASLTVTLEVGSLTEALTVSCKAPSVFDVFFPTLLAQERPSVPIRVGGQIKPPTKKRDVRPICPDGGVTDPVVVVLEGIIGADGFITGVKSVQVGSPAKFNESVIDAMHQWEFTPTLLNGVPVPVVITVTVTFRGA